MFRALITTALDLWRKPSAYDDDPTNHALNQIGHVCVGALLAILVPWWVALLLIVAWEASQLIWRGADPFDALEDVAFMSAGVFISVGAAWAGAVAAALLMAGVAIRSR